MNNSLENSLKETWKNKEKFYEDTKHLNIREIIEKIENKKFSKMNTNDKNIKNISKTKKKGYIA